MCTVYFPLGRTRGGYRGRGGEGMCPIGVCKCSRTTWLFRIERSRAKLSVRYASWASPRPEPPPDARPLNSAGGYRPRPPLSPALTISGSLPQRDISLRCYHYKKLSCRRDSARRLSLRRSRSFKVTDFRAIRKLVCDFVLVNNTVNLHLHTLSCTVFKLCGLLFKFVLSTRG